MEWYRQQWYYFQICIYKRNMSYFIFLGLKRLNPLVGSAFFYPIMYRPKRVFSVRWHRAKDNANVMRKPIQGKTAVEKYAVKGV